jgi:hypothetical protein
LRPLADVENWTREKILEGFAGVPSFRMVGTEADLNDHWVELYAADEPPFVEDWQRIICVHFRCLSGKVHVMSVIDRQAAITADVAKGDYAAYLAGQNLGVDQRSKCEDVSLTDEELAVRKDLEWYRIYLVPGIPGHEGRLKDDLNTRST